LVIVVGGVGVDDGDANGSMPDNVGVTTVVDADGDGDGIANPVVAVALINGDETHDDDEGTLNGEEFELENNDDGTDC
jgi:hypothetical protein